MEHDFWHRCWQNNEIGFHESQPNDLLMQYLDALKLSSNSVVFLPLCGKTLDIGWLLSQGHRVVGIELDKLAVEQLFKQLDMVPEHQMINDHLSCFRGPNITVYQGDIFRLNQHYLGSVDAIYDRAAMVALPEEMRKKYCQHIQTICPSVKQLLITFEYDQNQMSGPPFSISESDIKDYYGHAYRMHKLKHRKAEVRGLVVNELICLLTPGRFDGLRPSKY